MCLFVCTDTLTLAPLSKLHIPWFRNARYTVAAKTTKGSHAVPFFHLLVLILYSRQILEENAIFYCVRFVGLDTRSHLTNLTLINAVLKGTCSRYSQIHGH